MLKIGSRNLRNSIWNLANTVFYPVGFLSFTPFFMNHLGESEFGAWMVLNSIVFISVHLLHFGMGASIAMYVAECRGNSDKRRLQMYFNSALNFTLVVAAFVFIVAFAGQVLAPTDWFDWKDVSDPGTLKSAMIYTIGLIGFKFFEQLFMGFLKGFEEYDTAAKFNMIQKISMLLIQGWVVYLGYNLDSVILVSLITNAILIASQWLWIRPYLPGYQWTRRINDEVFERLKHFGFWTWLQTLISLMGFQLDRLVVAFALGANVVAYYSLASMIANHLHMIQEAAIGWIFPAVSRIKNENQNPAPLFYTVRGALLTVSLIGIAVLFLLRDPIFSLWLGPEKASNVLPFIELFLIFELFYVLTIAPKFYLNGLAELKLITGIELLYKSFGIIMMLGSFYFFRTATSLIWGQIFSMLISMPIVLALVNQKVLKSNGLYESFVLIIPSLFLFFALIADNFVLQGFLLVLSGILIYLVHLKFSKFRLTHLLE